MFFHLYICVSFQDEDDQVDVCFCHFIVALLVMMLMITSGNMEPSTKL